MQPTGRTTEKGGGVIARGRRCVAVILGALMALLPFGSASAQSERSGKTVIIVGGNPGNHWAGILGYTSRGRATRHALASKHSEMIFARLHSNESDAAPHGLKSWVAKKLLRSVASALRSSKAESVCWGLGRIGGKKIVNAICKHRLTVADGLNAIANLPGRITRQMIKEQLTGALHSAGLAHSTASEIAFHISIAIDWIIL